MKSNHLLVFGFFLIAACSSKEPPGVAAAASDNLSKIERAFDKAMESLRRPPANAEQLKPFLKEFGNPDEILRSPRDGEMYVIFFGVDIRKSFEMPPPIWAYEKNGVDGKRYVLTAMGAALMSDEDFSKAKFVKP